jgi:anti-anti-sigma factor
VARIYGSVTIYCEGFLTLSNMTELLTYTLVDGQSEGTKVLKLIGPLTLTTMFSFQNEFRATKPQVLILDLSETPYMDSAGLGLIMNYYVSAEGSGRKLLLASVNERVVSLLEMTKVDKVLKSYPTVETAEASL